MSFVPPDGFEPPDDRWSLWVVVTYALILAGLIGGLAHAFGWQP